MFYQNCRLSLCKILVVPVLLFSATSLWGQTSGSKAKPTGSISGRVSIGEKPVPGIIVVAGGLNSPTPFGQATTDSEGNYRIGGLATGQINVTPVAPVYVVPSNPMYGTGRVVNVGLNEAVDGVDFKLTRGGVITGRITDADGRPVIAERVNLSIVDENGAPVRAAPPYRAANYTMYETDDRGIYRIYGLSAGHYKVSAGVDGQGGIRMTGYYPRVYYPDAADVAKAAIVDVSEGGETKNIDIKLGRRGATYAASGRILDADTGQPLAGVYYSIGNVQRSQNESYIGGTSGPGNPTNSRGEFRMEGLQPGHYAAMVNPPMGNPNQSLGPKVYADPVQFEEVDGDVTNLEVKARSGLSISGVIVPDGITDKNLLARLSRFTVNAFTNPGPGEIRTMGSNSAARVNADGTFLIEGLRPGKVSLQAYGGDAGLSVTRIEYNGAVANRGIDLQPGQNLSGIKIFITYGTGVIRGQIKAEGAPLPTDWIIFVSVTKQGEQTRFGTQADSRGRFVINGIPAGTYEVILQPTVFSAQPPSGGRPVPQRQTVTVTENAEIEVTFTLDLTRKEGP